MFDVARGPILRAREAVDNRQDLRGVLQAVREGFFRDDFVVDDGDGAESSRGFDSDPARLAWGLSGSGGRGCIRGICRLRLRNPKPRRLVCEAASGEPGQLRRGDAPSTNPVATISMPRPVT